MRSIYGTSVRSLILVAAVGSFLAATSWVEAGTIRRVLTGLDAVGFNFAGERNFLSGGYDIAVSRQFNGETLDFGATELTLTGAPVLTFTTADRGLDLMEFSFNTNNNPFNYTLTTDTGNQITTLTGSLLIDATASINQFGFYDVVLDVSSRQTFTDDGRFSNDTTTSDFDIGPVDLRGNIYADLLAVVTDPIFTALGVDNIFAQFSASGQFQQKLDAQAARLQAKAASGQQLTATEISELGSLMATAAALGIGTPDFDFLSDLDFSDQVVYSDPLTVSRGTLNYAVPEPTSFALVAFGAAVLIRRRR